ncbi:MAG: FliM/FliN family flagellar motor switch protein [Pseudomonadota bacterium]
MSVTAQQDGSAAAPTYGSFADTLKQGGSGANGPASARAASVIEQIANSAVVNYERLPMLDVVFDRMVRLLTESLLHLIPAEIEIGLEDVRSARFGELMAKAPNPSVIGIIHAKEWEGSCLAVMDQGLVYNLVEVLLGGDSRPSAAPTARPPTSIERKLTLRLMNLIAKHLSEAFDPLTTVQFEVDRLETNPQFAAITRTTSASVHLRLNVAVQKLTGPIDIFIPYTTLEPIRNLLVQMFMGERFGRDAAWEEHFASELTETEIELEAVMHEFEAPLSTTLNWRPGARIKLSATPDSPTKILSGGQELFAGVMGQKNGKIAIRVDEVAGAEPKPAPRQAAAG